MAREISGVLFDIGGVLVRLDGVPSLARLLRVEALHDEILARWMACPSVVLHETGRLSVEDFVERVVTELGLRASAAEFLLEFDNWLGAPHSDALDLLSAIPGTYRVAALSNMSARHWERVKTMAFTERFDAIYLSHEIGCLKPSREAYDVALNGMALPAADVLFLDDGAVNVAAARGLGMNAHVVKNPKEARAVLERYGVLPA